MKHVFYPFSFLLFCVAILNATSPLSAQSDTAIYKTIGGTFEDEFKSVIYDNDSNLVFCGYTSSISQFGSKALLVKTDSLLNTLWSVSYGEYAVSNFTDLIQDGDTYIAVGSTLNPSTSYDILVAAFNENGELLWDKHIGEDNWDAANSISIVNGGYLITADTYDNLGKNALAIKIDTTGNFIWQNTYGGELDETFLDGRESIEGNLIFGGYKILNDSTSHQWFVKANAEGGLLFEVEIEAQYENVINSIVADPFEEAYFLCGHLFNPENSTQDAFISKISSSGELEFTYTLVRPGTQTFNNIELGRFDELLCLGFTENGGFGNDGKDFILRRQSRSNIFIEMGTYGTAGDDVASVGIRIHNAYITCGYTNGLGQGQRDAFTVRTRNSGFDDFFSTSEDLIENHSEVLDISSETTVSQFKFQVSNGVIEFSEPVKELNIFSLSGSLAYTDDLKGNTYVSPKLTSGVYLISTDGISRGKLFWP